MEMKADPSHVLMSDVLKGQVPELEGEAPADPFRGKHVVVVAEKIVAGKREGMVGILRGILFDKDPEIDFRVDLVEALNIVEANQLAFGGFELHHEERVIRIPGPFIVKAARIDDISVPDQLCTLSLGLLRKQA